MDPTLVQWIPDLGCLDDLIKLRTEQKYICQAGVPLLRHNVHERELDRENLKVRSVVTELIKPCTLGSTMCNVLIVCIHVW